MKAADGGGFDEGQSPLCKCKACGLRNAGIVLPKSLISVDYLRKSTTPKGGLIYSLSAGGGAERPPLTAGALAGMLTTGGASTPTSHGSGSPIVRERSR